MTDDQGDWTTPSQAEGERDDEPERSASDLEPRFTPSQAEGEREEAPEGGRWGSSSGPAG